MLSDSVARDTHQRVGIFVDVQNMFYSARTLHQSKVDYSKLLGELVGGRQLIRSVAYVVQKPDVDQDAFLEALRRAGYEVKIRELTVRDDGSARGDWDVGITVDVMTMANRLDTIILVTGDGDFLPLVDAIKPKGCRVEIVSFDQSTSNDLIRAAHDFVPISDDVLFKEEKFVREQEEEEEEVASTAEEDEQEYEYGFYTEE
ncbi:MAG: NYN domain-containing protein [Candidatus Brocadiia bacterium]